MLRLNSKLLLTVSVLVLVAVLVWSGTGLSAPEAPFSYPAVLVDGRKVGDLVLGETSLDQTIQMFPQIPVGNEGAPRPPRGYPEAKIGQVIPQPTLVFNPWMTQYRLYFDSERKLVIILDGFSKLRGLSREDMLKQFATLRETYRDSLEYEMQVEIQPCVTLMLLLSSRENTVGDIAYVFTCATK